MENRPTFEQLDSLSNNDLIRMRVMVEHVLFDRRVARIRPFVDSVSVARRSARQMTDAQITERIARIEETCNTN